MAGADGDGQTIHPRGLDELLYLVGVGVGGVGGGDVHVVLDAGQTAQLPFHHHAVGVGVLHHLTGEGDVVLEGMLGPVDHHGGEAPVDAGFADLKILPVVQVQGHGQAGVLDGGLHQLPQVDGLGILPGPGRHLEDQRGVDLLGCLGDALDDLHIVDVKGADGIAPGIGLLEHFCGCH